MCIFHIIFQSYLFSIFNFKYDFPFSIHSSHLFQKDVHMEVCQPIEPITVLPIIPSHVDPHTTTTKWRNSRYKTPQIITKNSLFSKHFNANITFYYYSTVYVRFWQWIRFRSFTRNATKRAGWWTPNFAPNCPIGHNLTHSSSLIFMYFSNLRYLNYRHTSILFFVEYVIVLYGSTFLCFCEKMTIFAT